MAKGDPVCQCVSMYQHERQNAYMLTSALELGSHAPELGSCASELGPRAPELGSRTPELGSCAPELGSRAPELGSRAPELGSRAPELGSRAKVFSSSALTSCLVFLQILNIALHQIMKKEVMGYSCSHRDSF